MDTVITLNTVLHPIGMACGSIVIASLIGLTLINKQLANTMTFRLVAVIAFTDILSHVGEYVAITNFGLIEGSAACTGLNGFRIFARTFYCWVNMAICFHIYRSVVLLKKSSLRSEIYIWATTVVLVTVHTLIYYGLGTFEGEGRGRCSPGNRDYSKNLANNIIEGLTNLITVVIAIFTVIKSHSNLNKWINAFTATATEQGSYRDDLIKERRKIASRTFLYPLSTIITLVLEGFSLILNAFGINSIELFYGMIVTTGLAGFLTAIAFSIDPATHKAFKSAYYMIKNRNTDKKDLNDQFELGNNDIQLSIVH